MRHHLNARLLTGWNLLIVAVLFVIGFSALVPYNMDEFIHYDAIICQLFPGNAWNTGCDTWRLNFLNTGLILPLRAFDYSGSFPALYLLPFKLLWNSPLMVRLLGLLFIAAGAKILAKEFRLPFGLMLAGLLLCFPYTFQHLVDTGPVSFHIFSVFLLSFLFRRWCETVQNRYALASALIVFCGIWTKFAYFWLVPPLAILLLGEVWSHRAIVLAKAHRWRFFRQLVEALLIVVVLVGALLLSTHPEKPDQHPYYDALIGSQAYSLQEMQTRLPWHRSGSFMAIWHPLAATQRVFLTSPHTALSRAYSILVYGFTPLALTMLLFLHVPRRYLLRPAGLYLLFWLTVFLIVRTKGSWAMHHAILSYPMLILSILAVVAVAKDSGVLHTRRWIVRSALVLAVFFAVINIAFLVIAVRQPIRTEVDASKEVVRRVIDTVSAEYVVTHLDWGLYFEQGLFSPSDQSTFYQLGLRNGHRLDAIGKIAKDHRRKMFFAYRRNSRADLALVKSTFTLSPCAAIPETAEWQILAEQDPVLDAACSADYRPLAGSSASSKILRAALAM